LLTLGMKAALPGVAQVAMQQGRYAGNLIRSHVTGNPPSGPFRYRDKGSLAIVGKNFAVLESGRVRLSGFLLWLRLVCSSPRVPGAVQPSGQRLCAMGMDVYNRAKQVSPHCETSLRLSLAAARNFVRDTGFRTISVPAAPTFTTS
jgi:hypothetical protein